MTVHEVEQQFAQSMVELRTERNLSQVGLADALRERGLNLDPTALLRMEKAAKGLAGARAIRLSEAVAIAEVFGLTVTYMLSLAKSAKERRIAALRAELAALEGGEV